MTPGVGHTIVNPGFFADDYMVMMRSAANLGVFPWVFGDSRTPAFRHHGPRSDVLGREVAAERPRTRNGAEKSEHVARHGMQPDTFCEFAFNVRNEGQRCAFRRTERRRLSE